MSVAEAVPYYGTMYAAVRPQPTVLVVEDERKARERLVGQLVARGITPLVATSGYEAIRMATQSRPDLILLDGLIPEMSGFDVARFIRKVDRDYTPRIVMLTALYKNVRYHNDAKLKYGIDDYMIKPISEPALEAIVEIVRGR